MSNPFMHVELHTDNVAKSKTFYQQLFQWKIEEMPMGAGEHPYYVIKVGEGVGGGMMAKMHPDSPTRWMPYVLVECVETTLKKAKEKGAKIIVEKTPVHNMGAYGVFMDPDGAYMGVWENAM